MSSGGLRRVEIGPDRVVDWVQGYADRHPGTSASAAGGGLRLDAADGSWARLEALLPVEGDGDPVQVFAAGAASRPPVGLLLVRRGGWAVGRVEDGRLAASKVGTRYVQSRTAAGGWSQQRYARRREQQAGQLLGAAAEAAARLLLADHKPLVDVLVTGGDRDLADRLLAEPVLARLTEVPRPRHLDVPDPRLSVLRDAVRPATAVRIELLDA